MTTPLVLNVYRVVLTECHNLYELQSDKNICKKYHDIIKILIKIMILFCHQYLQNSPCEIL